MKKRNRFQKEKQWFIRQKDRNKLAVIFIGALATLWFLIRVVPKPSRASYPCMQIAAPFASGFVLYLSGLIGSVFAWNRFRTYASQSIPKAVFFFILFIVLGVTWIFQPFHGISARSKQQGSLDSVNNPMGEARGIFPGRVVWVWNPDATNESCTNQEGDYWWQDENTDQQAVNSMLSQSIRQLTEEESDSLSWDAMFRYYNLEHGSGDMGYVPGEKISIKVNICSGGWGNVDEETYEKIAQKGMIDTSPQLILSALDQLVNVVGVAQGDISLGDPHRLFFDHYWQMCHSQFPDVHYLDWLGKMGRTKSVNCGEPVLFYSDGVHADSLPLAYVESKYMINIACLKQHDCAGVTFCAKNHFGSCGREMAGHLHYALPSPTPNGFENLGYGKYRNLVDLMTHNDLGEKTFLFMIDGLWGGEIAVCDPGKWQSDPFYDDWPSSLFVSQDPVAIESVGLDFVRAEFDEYAMMYGTDDYLHQAADSSNWAEGIMYDPENDGIYIASLGTHEHWNNNIDKDYSRNLGTGDGIELIKYYMTGIEDHGAKPYFELNSYPVPNPMTPEGSIKLTVSRRALINLEYFSLDGIALLSQHLGEMKAGEHLIGMKPLLAQNDRGRQLVLYRITAQTGAKQYIHQGKIVLDR